MGSMEMNEGGTNAKKYKDGTKRGRAKGKRTQSSLTGSAFRGEALKGCSEGNWRSGRRRSEGSWRRGTLSTRFVYSVRAVLSLSTFRATGNYFLEIQGD